MTQQNNDSQNPVSIWPRSGGNRSNQSRVPVPGPTKGEVFKKVRLRGLDPDEQGNRPETAGGVVATDGSLRVVSRGILYALSSKGKILWWKSLSKYASPETSPQPDTKNRYPDDSDVTLLEYFSHSLPTIINDLSTLIIIGKHAVILDELGEFVDQISIPTWAYEPPNLTLDEEPIFTSDSGGVFIWSKSSLVKLPVKGLDIEPVAVYDDGTLGISAYALDGYCRVRVDGTTVWKTTLKDADLLPTLNNAQYAAVGSVNDEYSIIFSPDGQPIGQYPAPAIFAVCGNDEWIASSQTSIARLHHTGDVLWVHPRKGVFDVFNDQHPIVCSDERVYFVDDNQMIALEGDGQKVWEVKLGDIPDSYFPIMAGVFGVMVGETLWFIH